MERINPLCMPFSWFFPHLKKMQCLFFFPAISSQRPNNVNPSFLPPKTYPFTFTLREWSSGVKKTEIDRKSVLVSLKYISLKKTFAMMKKHQECHCNYRPILGMWVTNTFSASGVLSKGSQPSFGISLSTILLTLNITRMVLLYSHKTHTFRWSPDK